MEGVARITEARLRRDVSEGRIVDFQRSDGGFEVVRREALNGHESKVRQQWFQHYCHSHNKRHSWVNRDGIIAIIVVIMRDFIFIGSLFIESTCFEIGYSTHSRPQYCLSAVDGYTSPMATVLSGSQPSVRCVSC